MVGMTGCRRELVSFSRLNRSPARGLPAPGAGPFRNGGCYEDQRGNDRTQAHGNERHARSGLDVRSGNWRRRVEAKRFGHVMPAENFQVDRVPAEYPDDAAHPAQPPRRRSLRHLSSLCANPACHYGRGTAHLRGPSFPAKFQSSQLAETAGALGVPRSAARWNVRQFAVPERPVRLARNTRSSSGTISSR
jgi:hypothetical protein